ncbi:hypothetical protein B296_00029290 [Ensete ventricosum]|uniref:FLZ-type domain-containing protein n=1 Tax=Ensete ventricosum TaxID=4639 RepID=A0A426Y644_ENSVE|nr:hypothetical protein B296_00029290 [Ensete ventricosum]
MCSPPRKPWNCVCLRPLGILIPWKDLRLRLQASKASTLMGRARSHGRGGRPDLLHHLGALYAILSSYFNYIPICSPFCCCCFFSSKFCKFVRLMDELMCRGDIPFCSEECRQEQIEMDEGKEKKWKLSLEASSRKDSNKGGSPTSPPNSHKVHVRTGTAWRTARADGFITPNKSHQEMLCSEWIRRFEVLLSLPGARLVDQDQEVSTDALTRRGRSRRGRATQSRTVRVPHRRRRAVVDLASIKEEESSTKITCNRVNGHRLDRLYVRANLGDHAEEARGW